MPTITVSDVGSVAVLRRPKCSFIVVQDNFEDDSIYFLLSGLRELTDDKDLSKAERKRLQIENAPHKSKRAALVKIGDKTSNVRSIALTPPDWPDERKAEYRKWASAVVSALPITSQTALLEFEEALKLR